MGKRQEFYVWVRECGGLMSLVDCVWSCWGKTNLINGRPFDKKRDKILLVREVRPKKRKVRK